MSRPCSDTPASPVRETEEGVRLALHVIPKARRNSIGAIREGRLTVYVTAAPEDGKANEAVIKLLAQAWKITPARFDLTSGHASRDKVLLIRGLKAEDLPL